jgi:uncharacterized membrane protein
MLNTTHIHPLIVHFPVALITVGFLAEIFSLFIKSEKCLSKAGFYLLILGALFSIAAWSSGLLFTSEPLQGTIVRIYEKHKTGAVITMLLSIAAAAYRICLVIRKNEEVSQKWIAFGLYCLAFASVTFTGFMGGILVYNFMMAL